MRRNSRITTSASGARTDGDGGNITINAPNGFIVAVRSENSDITANAFRGKGGRVEVSAQGLFGIQPRPRLTSLSDIAASSELGIPGIVEINTVDIDPSRGLVTLPPDPAAPQVAEGCQVSQNQTTSQFTITGRGGLPPNPGEALSSDAIQVDLVTRNPEAENDFSSATLIQPNKPVPEPIVEAQGWRVDRDGAVVLIAQVPTSTPHIPWQPALTCPSVR